MSNVIVPANAPALPASSLSEEFEVAWRAQRRLEIGESSSEADSAAAEAEWEAADARTRAVVERMLGCSVHNLADAKALARAYLWCCGDDVELASSGHAEAKPTDERVLDTLIRALAAA